MRTTAWGPGGPGDGGDKQGRKGLCRGAAGERGRLLRWLGGGGRPNRWLVITVNQYNDSGIGPLVRGGVRVQTPPSPCRAQ